MLGAIAGDIIGSPFEFNNYKAKDFPLFQKKSRFTDDTVLTVATADALLNGKYYADLYRSYARRYPQAGFGPMFARWVKEDGAEPYNSFGNGSGMRVSPVGLMFSTGEWNAETQVKIEKEAKKSADVTHNHPEGVKGAQAIAVAVGAAKAGLSKEDIKFALGVYGYDLDQTVDECRDYGKWNATCQGTVSESIICFLEGTDFEDCIRNAVSIGGDSDTIACMTGSIAHAFYKKIPGEIMEELISRVDSELLKVVIEFEKHVGFETTLT